MRTDALKELNTYFPKFIENINNKSLLAVQHLSKTHSIPSLIHRWRLNNNHLLLWQYSINVVSYCSHGCAALSWPGGPEANGPTRVISNFKWPPFKPYLGIILTHQCEPHDSLSFLNERHTPDSVILSLPWIPSIHFATSKKKQQKNKVFADATVPSACSLGLTFPPFRFFFFTQWRWSKLVVLSSFISFLLSFQT